MKILSLVVVSSLLFSCAAAGPKKPDNLKASHVTESQHQNQSKDQLVEALLELFDMQGILDKSISTMLDAQIQQNPSLLPYKDDMSAFMNKYMSYEQLKPGLKKIYMDLYSNEELVDIIAFYKTDTGKKVLETMPIAMQKGTQLGLQAVQDHLPELQTLIMEKQKKLEKDKKQ